MPYITTRDDAKLFYKSWGAGKPVILIHGWPLTSDTWDEVAIALAEAGFRAIAYDRRGFGRSEQTWSGYDYDSLTDDLADLISELDVDGAALIGFSMGGGEIARYMSRHQGKNVRAAVLVSSVVPYMLKTDSNPHGVDPAVFEQMTGGMKKDRAAFFAQFFKDFYNYGLLNRSVSSEILQWSWGQAMQASMKATLACAESFATTDFRPDLAAFKVPTLVIHGAEDRTVPIDATGRASAAGIKGAQLIEYSDGPHGVFASHKEALISDLLRFVQQNL